MEPVQPDTSILIDILRTKMPYGKHKGILIVDLPVSYLEWMHSKGAMPAGRLGMMIATIHEIKINGMMAILYELKKRLTDTPQRRGDY
ncbi:DUF3820 family protein [Mucilaginibacter jinjuensis]|uniref:DUF3820 family protein n=1 Tax=Mucilaginibacter jinjuensis TaxID=1176721 RepID=A0ABY7T2U3_9SPHI|nr:DUF3820 family protein [Mucilaginibacter jinjuensis]WCT10118.1 DUF3820 family protein [Mucilaginibacter jinjuensis]